MARAAREWQSETMGRPEPAWEKADVMGGPGRVRIGAEVMGWPQPAGEKADVMGGPEPARTEADVMGGPERPTDVMSGSVS